MAVVTADAADDHAPDQQLVALQNVARRKRWILRLQHDLRAILNQAFDEGVAIDRGDHNIAVARRHGPVDHHHVAIKNTDAHHALAIGPHQKGVWRVDIQQLIQGKLLFQMILRRARKAGRNAGGKKGSSITENGR